MIHQIPGSAWTLIGDGLAYRHTHRKYGPKGAPPTHLYFMGHPRIGGTPPRRIRKAAKMILGHVPSFIRPRT